MSTPTQTRATAAGFLALVALLACCPSQARAKAAFAGKADMIRRSDAVAVVDVLRVEKAQVKGRHWTYSQRAVATVRSTLKGDLPAAGKELVLFGGEDFICAQCNFQPGRHVVFLRRDGGLWVGCNWHLSVRPVATDKDGKEWVDWYAKDGGIALKATPLQDVLADVKRVISETAGAGEEAGAACVAAVAALARREAPWARVRSEAFAADSKRRVFHDRAFSLRPRVPTPAGAGVTPAPGPRRS